MRNNNDGRFMQTPISSMNQMNGNHSMSKSNSSGSYYMPEHATYNNHIPKPPQDVKGPSHIAYQNTINLNSNNMQKHNSDQGMNNQSSTVTSQALSNSNNLSSSSMQSSNQYENYDSIMGYIMKNGNSGSNGDNGSVIGMNRLQSPLVNMENNNSGKRNMFKKSNNDVNSFLES